MNVPKYFRFRTRFRGKKSWLRQLFSFTMLLVGLLMALPNLAYAQLFNGSDSQDQQSDQAKVKLPNTEYTESHIDLRVAAIGGDIKLNRTWVNGRWYLNPAWADLRFVLDPLNNSVKVIDRAGTFYQRSGQSDLYINQQVSIKKTDNGWRWSDLQGNWIDYDPQGRILAYGDANKVSARFVLDQEGRRIGINDTNGESVYQFAYDAQEHLIKASDRSGRSVSYTWSGEKLTKVTDVLGNSWQYGYDSNGQLNQKTDPDGGIVRIEYSASAPAPKTAMTSGKNGGTISQSAVVTTGAASHENKLARVGKITDKTGAITLYNSQYDKSKRQYTITVYDALGQKTVTRFDAEGKVKDQTINDKLTESYRYDTAKQLIIYTDARGQVTTTQYNQAKQPLKVVYPTGATELYEYNSQYQPVKFTNAKGDIATFSYNSKYQLSKLVYAANTPEHESISFDYDQYGQPITITFGEGAQASKAQQHYDRYGNVDSYTDAQGHQYSYSYNVQGQPVSLQNPLQQTWQLQYDAAGRLTKFTDPLQNSTQFRNDALGRLTRITNALGKVTEYNYLFNKTKREIQRTNALNQTTTYRYDAVGRQIQRQSPSGLISQLHYNVDGDLDSRTDAAGNSTSYEYGAKDSAFAGLLIKTSYPTYSETYQYDALGNPTAINQQFDQQSLTSRASYDQVGLTSAITDAAGHSVRFAYDALGRLIKQTNAQNHITQYQYDPLGNISQLINAKGETYQFGYDGNSNPTTETRSLGNNVQNRYNEINQLIEQQQANGQRVQYQYDANGNVLQERYFAPGQTTAAQEVSYQYDATGQLTDVIQTGETNSHFTYMRDALGRITQESISYGNITQQLRYSYNSDGQLASITYPDNNTVSYQYEKGQLTQTTLANGETIKWSDYRWLQPGKISYPNAVQTNQYDGLQRFSQISVSANGQSVFNHQYRYDTAGNLSHLSSNKGDTSYQYDSLNQLTQVTPSQELIGLGVQAETYSYDAIGNRIGSIGKQWSYNELGQLSQWGTTDNPSILNYNTNGHLTRESKTGEEREYHYNAADRLASISQNGTELASYQYDPFGRRISKTVNGNTTYYLYTDEGLIAELNQSGQMQVAYGWEPDTDFGSSPLWHADIAADKNLKTATYHYLITDQLGTPQLALDSTGQTVWQQYSDAFGNTILDEHNTITLNLRFAGQYYDAETGLSYNYYRDYDPKTGRYIESDPLGLGGGINTFAYVGGNPVNYVDPYGQSIDAIDVALFFAPGGIQVKLAKTGAKLAWNGAKLAVKACWRNKDCRDFLKDQFSDWLLGYLFPCYAVDIGLSDIKGKVKSGPLKMAAKKDQSKKAKKEPEDDVYVPPNMSPPGAGRRGAFRAAKRDAGIPMSQQPIAVRPNIDRSTHKQTGREYDFAENPGDPSNKNVIKIRQDGHGHYWGPNDPQNRGPHYNNSTGKHHFDY